MVRNGQYWLIEIKVVVYSSVLRSNETHSITIIVFTYYEMLLLIA